MMRMPGALTDAGLSTRMLLQVHDELVFEAPEAEAERAAELDGITGEKGDIGFGHQIRSYVLQPYTKVKDHRTDHETGNTTAVLDGDIEQFTEAYLRWMGARKKTS